MKKIKLLILGVALVSGVQTANAQTFTLSNYSPVTVVNDPWQDTDSHIHIENTSNSLKKVTIERTILAIHPSHLEFFCFGAGVTGLCYPPGTDVSNGQDTILANSVDQSFKATVRPMGSLGYTAIHYKIFDTDNPADSIGVDLAWDFTTSINENPMQFGLSKPLQNPADAYTVFNFNLQTNDATDKIVVFNMLGSKVKTMDIPGKSGALVLTTSDLKAGVYMVSYMSNGKVKDTCRLVVSHR
jgi:hypothetical protein